MGNIGFRSPPLPTSIHALGRGGGYALVAKSCLILATPWTVARQAPLSMGFSRQEYWSGLSFPSPGGLPDPGIEPEFPVSPALACGLFTSREVQPHDYAALISMHCRQILYCLSHQGSPFHLEWFSTTPIGATKQTNFLPDCPHSYCTSPGCNTFSSPLVLSC